MGFHWQYLLVKITLQRLNSGLDAVGGLAGARRVTEGGQAEIALAAGAEVPETMSWQRPLEGSSVLKLADNVSDAMAMMSKMTEIIARLPGLDCGTCGAPTCRALAEDIVRGSATLHDCVFAMRDELAGTDMQEYIPAPFRSMGKKEETK